MCEIGITGPMYYLISQSSVRWFKYSSIVDCWISKMPFWQLHTWYSFCWPSVYLLFRFAGLQLQLLCVRTHMCVRMTVVLPTVTQTDQTARKLKEQLSFCPFVACLLLHQLSQYRSSPFLSYITSVLLWQDCIQLKYLLNIEEINYVTDDLKSNHNILNEPNCVYLLSKPYSYVCFT